MIAAFQMISRSVSFNKNLLQTKNWDEDYQKLSSLLDIGVRATDENLKQLLGDGERAEDTIPTVSKIWAELGKSSSPEDRVEGWGKAAERTEKGVERLVKHLPEDPAEAKQ